MARTDDLDFPPPPIVVGIGASAGGVQALGTFLEALPAELGAALVVVVHLNPEAHSELPRILAAHSRMPVMQVGKSIELQADCVYVIPPDRQLEMRDGHIAAVPFEEPRGHRAPVDIFFRSLAVQHGDGFAIVMTGGGSDGAVGVKAVKEAGGIILVQDPAEAEYSSMPSAAIATEVADFVLPVKQLAERLVELIEAKNNVIATGQQVTGEEDFLRRILTHLRARTGHDFSHYKRSTVMRRLIRRMQVARRETFGEYFAYLRDNAEEVQALLGDLLISVTTFFRDDKAFESLARNVVPHLFRGDNSPIRVWVAGCATGEEAYSIAMLILEEAAKHEIRPEIQVFGSDMDGRALNIAREGRYPASIEADVSEDRLKRFFSREGEYFRIKRELRDVVLFANHSLLKDPPFSRLDLVSCRNLLIYLDRDLQQQVLATLHYGLNPEGYLFLGSSESGEHPDGLFRVVDRDARLYQSTGRGVEHLPVLPRIFGAGPQHLAIASTPPPISGRGAQAIHLDALEKNAPPSALVDQSGRLLHLSENAGRYLQPSGGPMTSDVTDLVRQEMRFELRSALHRAFERNEASLAGPMPVRFNGAAHPVWLQVRPLTREGEDGTVKRSIVFFIEGDADVSGVAAATGEADLSSALVNQLRQELELAQVRLRTMREESESANEELRAANEELQSINEEYRSTAEELETSKEELQSINEELQTVNSELKLKLESVSRANSDLQNLMAAMDFGTLFLDPGLRIKRFTPKLTDLFSVAPGDIGRSITDFTHQLDYDGFLDDVRAVLANLTPLEREVRSRSGGWYLARIRPYRTLDDKIDGVVATFVDITERRQMEDALRTSAGRLRQEMRLVELSRAPILVTDEDGTILQWNRGSEELYGYRREEALGKNRDKLLKTQVPGLSNGDLHEALAKEGAWKGELAQVAKGGRKLKVESHLELIETGGRRSVLESIREI